MSSSSRQFRVIIVGGGPVGLCLAHALSKAHIDYVLLEQRDTCIEESGLGLALWPHGVRILDQLGMLDEGRKLYLPMNGKVNLRPNGSEIDKSDLYDSIEQNHGHPWMLFRRQHLLDLLYNNVPDKEKRISTRRKVVSIESDSHGVKVHCKDGSVEEGSIIVGCDGVHSPIRGMVRKLALKTSATAINDEAPMVAHYQLLAGHTGRISSLMAGQVREIRNDGLVMQIFMLENEGWFLVYKRFPKPVSQYVRYTDEDAQAFAEEILDNPIGQGMKFRDVWEKRTWVGLLNVEEGMAKTWHWDRVVLVGDSAHKMTPNSGLSLNQGWQGVAALTNNLRRLVLTDPDPDNASLAAAFAAYQKEAETMAKDTLWLSALYTRATAWHNLAYKLVDYLGPYVGGDVLLIKMLGSPIVKQGIVLDFLPEQGHKAGRLAWTNKAKGDGDDHQPQDYKQVRPGACVVM